MKSIFLILILLPIIAFSQTNEDKLYSLKYGLGFGVHEGGSETGLGILGSFGFQKAFGKKKKLRLNPNISIGRFSSIFIFDVPSQKYTYASLDFISHFDLLRYKAFSIVTSAGGYLCLTSGSTDVFYSKNGNFYPSYKFTNPYLMASISGSLRFAPKNSKIAVDLIFPKLQLGTSNSFLGEFKISVDYKINK